MIVYAVEWGNEFPAEIDSLWTTEAKADERAVEKNAESISGADRWHVTEWPVHA